MRHQLTITFAVLLIIFVVISDFTGAAERQPTESLKAYDTNANNFLDDSEFFNIVDDWIAGAIAYELMFAAIDLWLSSSPIAPGQQSQSPRPARPLCPANGRLIAMLNGIPYETIEETGPDGGLAPPIDIAFSDGVYLPQGSNLQLTITSDTQGLEPRAGAFRPPFQYANFYNLGPSQLVGTGTIRDGTLVQAQYEWASFAPFWEDYASTGTLTFEALIDAPNCSKIRMSGKISIRKVLAVMDSKNLRIQSTRFGSIFSEVSGNGQIAVALYNSSGDQIYQSPFGHSISLSQSALKGALARGIYIYRIIPIQNMNRSKQSQIGLLVIE